MVDNDIKHLEIEKTAGIDAAETDESNQSISNEHETNPLTAEEFFQLPTFYTNAQSYWSHIEPTIDGMLGGLSILGRSDIHGSSEFLKELFKLKPTIGNIRALDCGAGIGRVTKNLLSKFFNTVDLVEQDAHFARKATEYLSLNGSKNAQVGEIYNEGLQYFIPQNSYYDAIWSQWVLGHLTDTDLLKFFKRCNTSLKTNGLLVIKENFTSAEHVSIDENDSSVTRPIRRIKDILGAAGFRVIKCTKQNMSVEGLFPVYMLACKPI